MTVRTDLEKEKNRQMRHCTLCPRACGADRAGGRTGVCGQTDRITAARAALHYWEEPCISGKEGSGTVFFSGCSLGCVFCQNRTIAEGSVGKKISEDWLAEIFLKLQEQKANNINLVTGGHFIFQIAESLEIAKARGLQIPVVYNTSGYEKADTLKYLEGLIDIYMPDFKYWKRETAEKYAGAADYPDIVKEAIEEMIRQTNEPVFDDRGIMRKGVLARHLILPGHVGEAKSIIRYLLETYKDRIYISIMNQYTPMPGVADRFEELGRKVTKREYERVIGYALELGLEQGFVQEGETAEESFIPPFDLEGI